MKLFLHYYYYHEVHYYYYSISKLRKLRYTKDKQYVQGLTTDI